jgi:hypothetical protein
VEKDAGVKCHRCSLTRFSTVLKQKARYILLAD